MTYTLSKTEKDLQTILDLQQENLFQNLQEKEMAIEGFVTVQHDLEDLQKMHRFEANILAKDNNQLAGYLLAMTKHSKSDLPALVPMFNVFDSIQYFGKSISAYTYLVVGQVCIRKDYRGKGILPEMYQAYKQHFKQKYDFAITEIDTRNQRSLKAHLKSGFKEIHVYTDTFQKEWSIVIWDWKKEMEPLLK